MIWIFGQHPPPIHSVKCSSKHSQISSFLLQENFVTLDMMKLKHVAIARERLIWRGKVGHERYVSEMRNWAPYEKEELRDRINILLYLLCNIEYANKYKG